MSWYDYIPGVAAAKYVGGALGIDKDALLGGTSKKPGEFYTPYAHEGQILGAINQGMGTNRTAPQAGMESPFRNAQLSQIGQLQGIASGQRQGAGELAVQRQAQNAAAQQQAMARMARGGNAILAQRGAANNQAAIGLSAAGQGQQAAMQDQMQAHGMLAQAAGQGRGQDQQVQLANLDAQLKQMGMDDASRLGYLQQLTGMDANTLAVQMGQYQAAQARPGMMGGLLSAGGQIGAQMAMASDERLKEEVTDASAEIDEMLDGLLPRAYVYKQPERWGKGRRAGIMAQDLERSEAGKRIVMDTPEGKLLDVNKALSAALASSARLNQRVRDLEKRAR